MNRKKLKNNIEVTVSPEVFEILKEHYNTFNSIQEATDYWLENIADDDEIQHYHNRYNSTNWDNNDDDWLEETLKGAELKW